MAHDALSLARHQFPPAIIPQAVWLYARFTLSYHDVDIHGRPYVRTSG
jgi:transposase-like protein